MAAPLSDDVLRMIFQEVHNSNAVPRTISGTQILLPTPTDPLSIAAAAKVCRQWRSVIRDCRELRSSIILQLPIVRHGGPHCSQRKHVRNFLHRLPEDIPVNTKIFFIKRMDNAPASQLESNLRALRPLIERAKVLSFHGYDVATKTPVYCIPLPFSPTTLRTLSFDHVAFRDRATGEPSLVPLLEFVRACSNLRELTLHRVQAVPVEGPFAVVRAPQLTYLAFVGQPLFFQEVLRHIEIVTGTRVLFAPVEDSEALRQQQDYPWHTEHRPDADTQQRFSPLALIGTADNIKSSLQVFEDVKALEIYGSTLSASFFAELPSWCPNLVKLTLWHCIFEAEHLKKMYSDHRQTSMLPDDILSSLTIKGCETKGMTSESLQHHLSDVIFNLSWDDQYMRKTTTREKLLDLLVGPARPKEKPKMLTPEPYGDDDKDFATLSDLEHEADAKYESPTDKGATRAGGEETEGGEEKESEAETRAYVVSR